MTHNLHFKHIEEKNKTKISSKNRKNIIKHNKFIDNLSMIAAILMPFTTIPQIYKIWVLQSTAGVSMSTWILYTILCIPMVIYGIYYKMKPIIVLNILWMIMNITMIIGLIIY